jgi:hypothetical protein
MRRRNIVSNMLDLGRLILFEPIKRCMKKMIHSTITTVTMHNWFYRMDLFLPWQNLWIIDFISATCFFQLQIAVNYHVYQLIYILRILRTYPFLLFVVSQLRGNERLQHSMQLRRFWLLSRTTVVMLRSISRIIIRFTSHVISIQK